MMRGIVAPRGESGMGKSDRIICREKKVFP